MVVLLRNPKADQQLSSSPLPSASPSAGSDPQSAADAYRLKSVRVAHSNGSSASPAHHDNDAASPENASSATSPSSHRQGDSQRPPLAPSRTRSSSSSLLRRFASRRSIISVDAPSLAGSETSALSGKIDKDALTKPRGKFKSGINWDSAILLPSHDTEAYVSQQSPLQSPEDEVSTFLEDEESRKMLAAGGTAAAAAYYRTLGTAATVFPAQQRDLLEASRRAAVSAQGPPSGQQYHGAAAAAASRFTSGGTAGYGPAAPREGPSAHPSSGKSPQPGTPGHLRYQGSSSRATRADGNISQTLTSSSEDKFLALRAAPAGPSSPNPERAANSNGKLTPTSTNDEAISTIGKSPAPSDRSGKQRRGFLGMGSKPTVKVNKLAGKASSRRGSEVSLHNSVADGSEDSRSKRRYPNTRELDVLASELANEAAIEMYGMPAMGPHASWGPSTSVSRTPAVALANGIAPGTFSTAYSVGPGFASPHSSPSSVSLVSDGNSANGYQPFVPPFARQDRPSSTSSSHISSPLSSSTHDLAAPTTIGSRGFAAKPSGLASGSATPKAGIDDMPREMLIGLGDSAYPYHPPAMLTDNDSYTGSEGSGINSGAGTPRRSALSGLSSPVIGSPSLGQAAPSSARKATVLSMTMHDPQAELQGLTKLPKSSKSNTPWGSRAASRAPSRSVTPKTSAKNLSELAKLQSTQLQACLSDLPGVGASDRKGSNESGRREGSPSLLGRKISPDRVVIRRAAVPTPVAEESGALPVHPLSASSEAAVRATAVQDADSSPRSDDLGGPPVIRLSLPSSSSWGPIQSPDGKKKGRQSFFGSFKSRDNLAKSTSSQTLKSPTAPTPALDIPAEALPSVPSKTTLGRHPVNNLSSVTSQGNGNGHPTSPLSQPDDGALSSSSASLRSASGGRGVAQRALLRTAGGTNSRIDSGSAAKDKSATGRQEQEKSDQRGVSASGTVPSRKVSSVRVGEQGSGGGVLHRFLSKFSSNTAGTSANGDGRGHARGANSVKAVI